MDHFSTKSHKKVRDELGLEEQEDLNLSPIILTSRPGSITNEIQKLQESAMKVKYKKIKQQMINKGVSHEIAAAAGKDITTARNKKAMQILSMELEKIISPTISSYSELENKLNSLISIISRKRQEELNLLRKIKIIPWVSEICKKISLCPRNEIKDLVRSIELAMQILVIFVTTRENRDYMLSTNRVMLLTDLLAWTLSKPAHLFFSSTYVPMLLEVITVCLKHKTPYEHQQMKALLLEYLLLCPVLKRIKMKFESVEGPLQLTGQQSLVPAIICESLNFLEVLTSLIGMDSRYRPVFEKSSKISPNMHFMIQKTHLMYIVPLLTDVILSKALVPKEMLPNSILNIIYMSLKLLNNMFRINLALCQEMLTESVLCSKFLILMNYIIKYCYIFEDQGETKDILYKRK